MRIVFVASVLLLVAAAAQAQDVRYNFDKQANFSGFKTYKWVVLSGGTKVDDLRDRQIHDAVDAQLAAKGLTKVTGDTADLYVTYQAAIDKEKRFDAYSTGANWGFGPGWGYGGWWGGPSSTWTSGETTTIYVGQLAVDVYDAAKKTLVWRGVVSKTLNPDAKPEKQQKNLDKAVTKLFAKYPPQPES